MSVEKGASIQSMCVDPGACGNGTQDVGEQCDDGNSVNGDGCDNNCTLTGCGNGIVDVGEQCDDSNTHDGDACEGNCTRPFCGNGIVDIGEQCDDGNTIGFDGCSSTCGLDAVEIEPNEDGTPSTGGFEGNDFSTVNANGPFTGSVVIRAAISPAGDEDVFRFTNQSASTVTMKFDTWDSELGIGVPCPSWFATSLYIRDATGALLARGRERGIDGLSVDYCSRATISASAGETVYVQILDLGDSDVIPGYLLEARYLL